MGQQLLKNLRLMLEKANLNRINLKWEKHLNNKGGKIK